MFRYTKGVNKATHAHERIPFSRSHKIKLATLWTLFALASLGTYVLAHNIESQSWDAAAVFLSGAASHEIGLSAEGADPTSIIARKGDEIAFVVRDASTHDIAEERSQRKEARLDSGEIGKGDSYSLVFKNSGVFYFYDRLHQDLHITITVK